MIDDLPTPSRAMISKHIWYNWPVHIERVVCDRTGQHRAFQAVIWGRDHDADTWSVHSVHESESHSQLVQFTRRELKKDRAQGPLRKKTSFSKERSEP